MSCGHITTPFRRSMDIFRWRFMLLVIISLQSVLYFSKCGQVLAQNVYFPQRYLQLAKETLCVGRYNCGNACRPGDLEPESMCFSACNCPAPKSKKNRAPAKCDPYGDCICPTSKDQLCPYNSMQLCTFEDGVICETARQYCVNHKEAEQERCECKDGWTGPNCEVCIRNCGNGASSEAANNLTAMILGSLLVIVVLALLCLIILYWKYGRLPCQAEKPKPDLKKADPGKPPLGNAYSVSGPMPIAEPEGAAAKRPGISPPDADTGEIENEYAYAAINEYATIGAREKSMRPAVPTAPVPSVTAAKTKTTPYYFQLLEGEPDQKLLETSPSTSATTTATIVDCYTKVIRNPKEEKPKPPVSQYDLLDRTHFRPPPTSGSENGSPSDNEYGTLASTLKSENIDLK